MGRLKDSPEGIEGGPKNMGDATNGVGTLLIEVIEAGDITTATPGVPKDELLDIDAADKTAAAVGDPETPADGMEGG